MYTWIVVSRCWSRTCRDPLQQFVLRCITGKVPLLSPLPYSALEMLLVLTPRCAGTSGHVLPTMRYLEATELQAIGRAHSCAKFANCTVHGAVEHGLRRDELFRK